MYRENYYSIKKARSAFESKAQSEKCIAQKYSSHCVTENVNAPSKFYLVVPNAVAEIIPTSEHQHFPSQCNDPGVLISNIGQINNNCDEQGTSVSSVLCSSDDSTDSCSRMQYLAQVS